MFATSKLDKLLHMEVLCSRAKNCIASLRCLVYLPPTGAAVPAACAARVDAATKSAAMTVADAAACESLLITTLPAAAEETNAGQATSTWPAAVPCANALLLMPML